MNEVEIILEKLRTYFGDDEEKVDIWMITPNPNFGGSTPINLIAMGRGDKVILFIDSALEGY